MRTYKRLHFTLLMILLGFSGITVAQERKSCELKAKIEIETSPNNTVKNAVVKLDDGVSPIKYMFFEEISGRMIQKDFSKGRVDNIRQGSYICIVVDDKGCSKKIQFQIQ